MHMDPSRVRSRYAAINLDEYERALFDALVNYTGMSRATLLRQLALKEALETLGIHEIAATEASVARMAE